MMTAAELDALDKVLDEVEDERHRQQEKWGEQNHVDGTGPRVPVCHQTEAQNAAWWARARTNLHAEQGRLTYLEILLEEVFEASEAERGSDHLRAELIQVAAVAVAWVEKMDRDRVRVAQRAGTPAAMPKKGSPRG